MFDGNPGAIENQEAQGQKQFINSDVLPVKIGPYSQYDEKEILESFGFKFLGIVEGDEIFQNVGIPYGWKKEAMGHSMWSNLVDDKGRIRAGIFYKAAFYDRSAHMFLNKRYNIEVDYEKLQKGIVLCHAKDEEKIIFSTTEHTLRDFEKVVSHEIKDKHLKLVEEWLNKNYPNWQNPREYWSE